MYKIKMTCFDPPYTEPPYFDYCDKKYERKSDAYHDLLECAIDTEGMLNSPDAYLTPRNKIFFIERNCVYEDKKYPAAIIMWNGALGIEFQPITLYDIVWENENPLDPWNQKLRDKFGEDITFGLYSELIDVDEEDEDGHPVCTETEKYYYKGLVTGKSDLYDTIEEAYEEAVWFLDNIELFVDCD